MLLAIYCALMLLASLALLAGISVAVLVGGWQIRVKARLSHRLAVNNHPVRFGGAWPLALAPGTDSVPIHANQPACPTASLSVQKPATGDCPSSPGAAPTAACPPVRSRAGAAHPLGRRTATPFRGRGRRPMEPKRMRGYGTNIRTR